MSRNEVAFLVKNIIKQDDINQNIHLETKKKIFCKWTSVSSQEWFEGGRNGLQPELRLTMFAPDYNGEKIVEIFGKRYSVYRTYQPKSDEIELYLERKSGVENG